MRHAVRARIAAVLGVLAVGVSCSDDDAADATTAAPPSTTSAPDTTETGPAATTTATAAASTEPPGSSAAAATDETVIAAPVAVTACVNPGPDVTSATEELIEVSLPDGEVTMRRERGWLWQSRVSDVSDPRLEGTWYNGADGDGYTLPGGAEVSVGTETHRIENDAGAWQGSKVTVGLPEGMFPEGAIGENYIQVLIGEGAYEGLTWVGTILMGQPCPNTKGYIIEGPVPAPPVPMTGQ